MHDWVKYYWTDHEIRYQCSYCGYHKGAGIGGVSITKVVYDEMECYDYLAHQKNHLVMKLY